MFGLCMCRFSLGVCMYRLCMSRFSLGLRIGLLYEIITRLNHNFLDLSS